VELNCKIELSIEKDVKAYALGLGVNWYEHHTW